MNGKVKSGGKHSI